MRMNENEKLFAKTAQAEKKSCKVSFPEHNRMMRVGVNQVVVPRVERCGLIMHCQV